jgi:hypothetical protein
MKIVENQFLWIMFGEGTLMGCDVKNWEACSYLQSSSNALLIASITPCPTMKLIILPHRLLHLSCLCQTMCQLSTRSLRAISNWKKYFSCLENNDSYLWELCTMGKVFKGGTVILGGNIIVTQLVATSWWCHVWTWLNFSSLAIYNIMCAKVSSS